MSDMCCAIRLWAYLVIVLNVKIDNQTEKKVSINTSLLDRVNEILPREEGRGIKWPVSVPNEYYSTWWVQSKLGVSEMKYVLQWNKQFSMHRMGIENRNAGIYKELTQVVLFFQMVSGNCVCGPGLPPGCISCCGTPCCSPLQCRVCIPVPVYTIKGSNIKSIPLSI